ncbi:hypothetical protein [Mucilaginibacter sp.]
MVLSFTQKINEKPNYFIEKIWVGLDKFRLTPNRHDSIEWENKYLEKFKTDWECIPGINFPAAKIHTIREDKPNRWKPGNDIHFVINNRTANRFQFAPIIKCKSVQTIQIKWKHKGKRSWVKVLIDGKVIHGVLHHLAPNDGFGCIDDFLAYFNKDFTGKIIHWTDLKYSTKSI